MAYPKKKKLFEDVHKKITIVSQEFSNKIIPAVKEKLYRFPGISVWFPENPDTTKKLKQGEMSDGIGDIKEDYVLHFSISSKEASKRYGLTITQVYSICKSGKIHCQKASGRWKIKEESLKVYLESQEIIT